MPITLDEATRKQVAVFLPDLINKTLQSYQDFMSEGPDMAGANKISSKSFSEYNNAGKIALAHLELLLELAALAHIKTDGCEADIAHLAKGRDEANSNRRLIVPDPLAKDDGNQ